MANRRSTNTQLAQLNAGLMAQNDQLKNIARVANQTLVTGNNIENQLYRQREVVVKTIDKNQNVTKDLNFAAAKTNQMRRRNLCIKLTLWIVILLLLASNIGYLIYKLAK